MAKSKKQDKRAFNQPPHHAKAHRPTQVIMESVPATIVNDARKTSHHIIETLSKTALAISSADNASEKLNVIQSLWNMQKEAEDRQAEREFNVAKVAVAQKLPPIPKTKVREFTDKNNVIQRSTYADLDDIEGVLDPICREYGLVKEYSSRTVDGKACQVLTVRHVSGHKETYESPFMPLDTSGSKNNNQAAGSTAKYGRRYALIGAFNIFHVDEDTDGATPVEPPKEDKFAQRVQAEAKQPEKSGNAMTLTEAAAALESKLRNAEAEKRLAILEKHMNIIKAMEFENPMMCAKATELRNLAAGNVFQEGGQ